MPRYLIGLSLGPVQSLIADARRTRDLWCGSWLLSEAARAAARALHERQPGCLIFPCLDDFDGDLQPQEGPVDGANIANVLRAEATLDDARAVLALCNDAKSAAVARVRVLGEQARRPVEHALRSDVWEAQINDLLEIFAAWAEIDDRGYADASQRLGRVLSARKATRDFRPCAPLGTLGLPKSSLDGARETVLRESPAETVRAKLALSAGVATADGRQAGGEQLDTLGVLKRLAGDPEQFTAWPRIAADSWIEGLTPGQRQRLHAAYERLVRLELATRVRGNAGTYAALPFDGHLLYPSRLNSELARERERRAEEGSSRRVEALEAMQKCIRGIDRGPVPYAAVLKADGDRVGALLSRTKSPEQSRRISRQLAAFASDVRGIVRSHRGHAVYAGGDDVLALIPLARALDCARKLAESFAESLGGAAEGMQVPADERPTLSVGIGIGYVIEPMGALRAVAERAEHDAKSDAAQPRNALAIRLKIRSGAELSWRARWNDAQEFEALRRFTDAYRTGELPARAAYDLREIDQRLAWLRGDDSETARGMRRADVERMLDRARRSGGSRAIPDALRALIRDRANDQPLAELADTLIIARWLAARTAADVGEQP